MENSSIKHFEQNENQVLERKQLRQVLGGETIRNLTNGEGAADLE
ncbi:hypothetical protein [Aquimarina sp. 2201CG14-23]|nr:hypothetical protein [Aquimarina sp. 2201CG14-23]MDH7447673.1 hypothetical protein [Aquimarina sp. 2201CG14-23]